MRDHGLRASYDTLRRFAIDERGWRKQTPTVLVADGKPGEEAQVDFGLMGTIHDAEVDRARRLYVLVVTLVVSRFQFVLAHVSANHERPSAKASTRPWRFFGRDGPCARARQHGRDDRASRTRSRARSSQRSQDYVQTRGIFVDPARVRAPKDKGRVENQDLVRS